MVTLWVIDFVFRNEPLLWKPGSSRSLSVKLTELYPPVLSPPGYTHCVCLAFILRAVMCWCSLFQISSVTRPLQMYTPWDGLFFCIPQPAGEPLVHFLSVDLPVWDVLCQWTWTVCALLWLASLTWHIFEVDQCGGMDRYLIPLSCWKVFVLCMHHLFVDSYVSWWAFGLFHFLAVVLWTWVDEFCVDISIDLGCILGV